MRKGANYFTGCRIEVFEFRSVGRIAVLSVNKSLRIQGNFVSDLMKINIGL